MHGLAVMAEVFHRKPFGIAGGSGPFSPGVTVTVKRHALDAKLPTTLAGRVIASYAKF
jgi:hypothetical protein